MVLISVPQRIDCSVQWPRGPTAGPWTEHHIHISQVPRHENWKHVLESSDVFHCFHKMCADFLDNSSRRNLPADLEDFVAGERKAYFKAFAAAQKKVQKRKVDTVRHVSSFTERVKMLHCYMDTVPAGWDTRRTARTRFRHGPVLEAYGIELGAEYAYRYVRHNRVPGNERERLAMGDQLRALVGDLKMSRGVGRRVVHGDKRDDGFEGEMDMMIEMWARRSIVSE
ncbi:hypothetical protein M406DRAFT_75184 [Cryphonectria parasitica EP155]|uniref:Uncharacterized protein n=1 Tax=Cryphonectria parasitica (strain ATCC 38755 / EP155) TaxID=660469 RepID=A0A9P4XZ25_CRYP1|nr:uncharacterized protein M406DRAFT_75184 [Cryphonectria parasitica EP155]KAF3763959.1 hypothetical protein M406DRAFT_75184 [Cryphonectria parasitica EP155]